MPSAEDDFLGAIDRFTRQSDRGTVLIASAWIDDSLRELLRAHFRPDHASLQQVLEGTGPLATFSSRIQVAYLLDLIEETARKDLDLIRKIRNLFAHARGDLRFRDP